MQCIKRLYNCQNAGIVKENCPNVELCVQSPQDDTQDEIPSYLPPPAADVDNNRPSKPQIPEVIDPPTNGHGKPVGTFTDEELFKPSTYSTAAPSISTTPIVMGSKPTNRKIFFLPFEILQMLLLK